MRFASILFAVLLMTTPPAQAQTVAPETAVTAEQNQRLMQFAANNDDFDKNVSVQARTSFLRQFPNCPSVDQVVRQLPQAYGELTFPGANNPGVFPPPTNGLWVEHVKIRACNKVRQINMLSAGQNDGTVVMLSLLPGETLADPAIQREAERIGATAITKADATCSDVPMAANTRVLGYKQANDTMGKTDANLGWFEEWDYHFCQKDVAVQMAFTPKDSGALDIKARPADVAVPQTPTSKPINLKAAAPVPAVPAATADADAVAAPATNTPPPAQ